MDRRFLSQAEVIAASRKLVCVRLPTYEDRGEADFLRNLFVGRSGELENTTFAILSPDGKQQLVRAGRSPTHGLSTASQLADTMKRLTGQYQLEKAAGEPALPKAASVRLGLDIAACDSQPLAVVYSDNAAALREVEDQLRQLAWHEDFVGRLVYAATADAGQLKVIEGISPGAGLIVVQPDRFGLKGKVLAQAAANARLPEFRRALRSGLDNYQQVEKVFPLHIRDGHRAGIFWETLLPVTDPMEKRAREKGQHPPPS